MTKSYTTNSLRKVWPVLGGWAGHKHTEGWAGEGESVGKDLTKAPVLECLLACECSRWSLMFFRRELQVISVDYGQLAEGEEDRVGEHPLGRE